MPVDPIQFRERAAEHAETALTVAAEIVSNEELAPSIRLEAGKWITKVADLEPKQNPQGGGMSPFILTINLGEVGGREEKIVLSTSPVDSMLDRLLGGE